MTARLGSTSWLANPTRRLRRLASRLRADRAPSRPLAFDTPTTIFAARANHRPTGDQGRALRRWMVARRRADLAAAAI